MLVGRSLLWRAWNVSAVEGVCHVATKANYTGSGNRTPDPKRWSGTELNKVSPDQVR